MRRLLNHNILNMWIYQGVNMTKEGKTLHGNKETRVNLRVKDRI